ncbi:hypothetical protein KPL76_11690 [Subtercola sp. PAMC28395]|uniref:hypothetical protein n=1 Tax=Subtercola sp. PAMC28395 TaxID=2846775 RepID=UPI001C0E84FD|nr:hypothetical protein [Subtercola sp. PAMC28395]QWT23381.1 hypothetical protein KPL76_11690 [Subtercola sp. PAMC28395]
MADERSTDCMVDGCQALPDDEVTIDLYGLRMVYTICSEHAQDVRWGAPIEQDAATNRGLVGPA